MNNKKTWLIILLAGILAILVTFFVFWDKKQAPITEETDIKQEEQVVEEVVEPQIEVKEETSVKRVVKPETPVKQETQVQEHAPVVSEEVKEEEISKSLELKEESRVFQDKDGVLVIPVGYSTQSKSKYVYTPARFNKK